MTAPDTDPVAELAAVVRLLESRLGPVAGPSGVQR